jgi:threonine/homoserine/homoserine lactone efflux protein
MAHFLVLGIVLGLSAGFAPGPLLTLVISETLQHDVRSGVKVALAPIVTDLPIILLTCLVLAKLANFHALLGFVSLAGGFFVLRMGYQSLRSHGVEIRLGETKPRSLAKGIVTNLLSPHPYLFWFGVGAPTVVKAAQSDLSLPLFFICGFYTCLVGSKLALALLVGKTKTFLRGTTYIYTMRFLGLLLCILSLILFKDGLALLGILSS